MGGSDGSRASTVRQWVIRLIVIIALIVVESPSVGCVKYGKNLKHCNSLLAIYLDPAESDITGPILLEYNNARQKFISNDQSATILLKA